MRPICSIDIGEKNMGICIYSPAEAAVKFWVCATVDRTGSDLCPGVQRQLDMLLQQGIPFHHVVIEKQLGTNARACKLEGLVQMYFAVRQKPVTLFAAKKKLVGHGLAVTAPLFKGSKPRAKQLCSMFLQQHPQCSTISNIYAQARKKDDLADCLLQALAFVRERAA